MAGGCGRRPDSQSDDSCLVLEGMVAASSAVETSAIPRVPGVGTDTGRGKKHRPVAGTPGSGLHCASLSLDLSFLNCQVTSEVTTSSEIVII